ncbi:hypothetical protein DP149_00835 [Clostridium tetani]|uniref:Uncharacterized protein n=2 Tax=Clostridium tetani TaxID=1513 RepID=A0ABY0ESW2_CLOTA|nr:hypothetical protein EQG73_02125 [Clostridium tetani]QBD86515.1 hypothetical protein EW636_02125 [Clostridium tetani]RXI40929.1 hypothetical protein DP129_01990 [Clostridium tetani]RXI52908.1 hypothetical protein DP124_07240 [Clostridium tetani]RXI55824.1 hypothetical protein DP122_04110 [Clostridium tetani]
MMPRIWGKLMKDNRMVDEEVVAYNSEKDYEKNLEICIKEICNRLDISNPYWLPINHEEFEKMTKTTFNKDNFMEDIQFDKFIIEELDKKEE